MAVYVCSTGMEKYVEKCTPHITPFPGVNEKLRGFISFYGILAETQRQIPLLYVVENPSPLLAVPDTARTGGAFVIGSPVSLVGKTELELENFR
jgi:hypothetical protein